MNDSMRVHSIATQVRHVLTVCCVPPFVSPVRPVHCLYHLKIDLVNGRFVLPI